MYFIAPIGCWLPGFGIGWIDEVGVGGLRGDRVPVDDRQPALEPVGLAGVVEHRAAADAHEVAFVARLDDALLELGELGVALLEHDACGR